MHGGQADNNFLSLQHGAAVCTSVSTAHCREVAEAAHGSSGIQLIVALQDANTAATASTQSLGL